MRLRLIVAVTLASVVTACSTAPQSVSSPSATAAATEATTATATAAPTQEPTSAPSPVFTPIPKPSPPAFAPQPVVHVRSNTFTVAAMPGLVEGAADERKTADQVVKAWAPQYLETLDRIRASYTNENRLLFDSFVVPGPYSEVVKHSLGGLYSPGGTLASRKLSLTQLTLEHVYAKPWGRVAYVDVYMAYDDTIATASTSTVEPHVVRVRLVNQGGFFMRVLDGFDTVLGRWINGDFPRYSALALESEAPYGVAAVLQAESYVKGEASAHSGYFGFPVDTPFAKARDASIKALDAQYQRGDFVERRYDGATATILSFEPATFIGDGVVTVRLDAQLVTIDAAGKSRTTPVTRTLRFYRITRDGVSAGWWLVDEQGTTGAWLSGGDLALAQIDVSRG